MYIYMIQMYIYDRYIYDHIYDHYSLGVSTFNISLIYNISLRIICIYNIIYIIYTYIYMYVYVCIYMCIIYIFV